MCEEHAIERLMSFNFVGISDEVESALSFKARNADPRMQPFYSRILYTWYVTHGDYRNGEPARLCRSPLVDATYNSGTCNVPACTKTRGSKQRHRPNSILPAGRTTTRGADHLVERARAAGPKGCLGRSPARAGMARSTAVRAEAPKTHQTHTRRQVCGRET